MTSKKPYLFRAIYDWVSDNGMTPHVLVDASYEGVIVPNEYVVRNQILLNVSEDSIDDLRVDEEALSFHAYFGESSTKVMVFVPLPAVLSIFAAENSEGLVFEKEDNDSFTKKISSAAKKKILQKIAVKRSQKKSDSSSKKPDLKIVKD